MTGFYNKRFLSPKQCLDCRLVSRLCIPMDGLSGTIKREQNKATAKLCEFSQYTAELIADYKHAKEALKDFSNWQSFMKLRLDSEGVNTFKGFTVGDDLADWKTAFYVFHYGLSRIASRVREIAYQRGLSLDRTAEKRFNRPARIPQPGLYRTT